MAQNNRQITAREREVPWYDDENEIDHGAEARDDDLVPLDEIIKDE